MHQEILSGINHLGTEETEGLDSDVINPPSFQEVCQQWKFFPQDGMDLTEAIEGENPLL